MNPTNVRDNLVNISSTFFSSLRCFYCSKNISDFHIDGWRYKVMDERILKIHFEMNQQSFRTWNTICGCLIKYRRRRPVLLLNGSKLTKSPGDKVNIWPKLLLNQLLFYLFACLFEFHFFYGQRLQFLDLFISFNDQSMKIKVNINKSKTRQGCQCVRKIA